MAWCEDAYNGIDVYHANAPCAKWHNINISIIVLIDESIAKMLAMLNNINQSVEQ